MDPITNEKERPSKDCKPMIKQFECAICKTNHNYKKYSKYRNDKTQFCTLEEVYYICLLYTSPSPRDS